MGPRFPFAGRVAVRRTINMMPCVVGNARSRKVPEITTRELSRAETWVAVERFAREDMSNSVAAFLSLLIRLQSRS